MPAAYIPVFFYCLFLLLIPIASFFVLGRSPVQSEAEDETIAVVPGRRHFSANYCLGAMIYVVVAVHAVFLFSWVILYRVRLAAHAGLVAMITWFVFVAVLSVGYIWLYKKDAFDWGSDTEPGKDNSETN